MVTFTLLGDYNRLVDIVEFVKSYPIKEFVKGEMLLGEGEQTETVLIIREGAVKVYSVDDSGGERLLWLSGRYDIIPTENLLSPLTTAHYFYTAFSDGSAYIVSKKDLLDASIKDNGVMLQVARGMSEHNDDLLARIDTIGQTNLRSRVLFMLHNISTKFSSAAIVELHEIGLNLTHQDIADMVHSTREATSVILKQLQDEGFIDYSRLTFTVYCEKISSEINTPQ